MFEHIPRPLFLLSTTAKTDILGKSTEKDNLMTLDWFMPLSKEPMMCAIAIKNTRFSYKLIKESKVFVLNLMAASKKKELAYCGEHSGEFIDKFEKTGLTKIDAESIHCCAVKESITRLECEVEEEMDVGDHTLLIARITKASDDASKKIPLLHFKKSYASLNLD